MVRRLPRRVLRVLRLPRRVLRLPRRPRRVRPPFKYFLSPFLRLRFLSSRRAIFCGDSRTLLLKSPEGTSSDSLRLYGTLSRLPAGASPVPSPSAELLYLLNNRVFLIFAIFAATAPSRFKISSSASFGSGRFILLLSNIYFLHHILHKSIKGKLRFPPQLCANLRRVS